MSFALHSPKFEYFNFAEDLVKRKLKKFGMVIKLKKKGDLNSPISPISKTSFFFEKALKMILQQIEKLKTN